MLIFLDVETTGLEVEDKICSLGIIYTQDDVTQSFYDLVNEGKKIKAKASSINHITNEMLKGKPSLCDSTVYKFLVSHNNENTTIIGHNIKYDIQKLSQHGFEFKGAIIDTLRVSKHMVKECESYALQFLRYELKLYREEEKELEKLGLNTFVIPHNSLYDSFVTRQLYTYLLEMISDEEMCELSFKEVLLEKFEFGKYAGRFIEEISMNDRNYLDWMMSNIDLDDDLRYSIDYYLQG